MQVKQFLSAIGQNKKPLLFEYAPGKRVQGGYHVTEIKNAQYDTIDCGNSVHRWQEVIVQVWVPEEAQESEPHMPTAKFRKIWDVVDSRLSLFQDAEIRIEFGDGSNLTAIYHVDGVVDTEDGLIVQMAPPRTMCKPREILVPFGNAAGVVANAVNTRVGETVIPLAVGGENTAVCCSPASSETSCCN